MYVEATVQKAGANPESSDSPRNREKERTMSTSTASRKPEGTPKAKAVTPTSTPESRLTAVREFLAKHAEDEGFALFVGMDDAHLNGFLRRIRTDSGAVGQIAREVKAHHEAGITEVVVVTAPEPEPEPEATPEPEVKAEAEAPKPKAPAKRPSRSRKALVNA